MNRPGALAIGAFVSYAQGSWGIVFALAVTLNLAAGANDALAQGFSADEMVGRMDANRNGQIEPDEFQNSRARYFLERSLREAGVDTSKSMSVSKIKEVVSQRFRGSSSSSRDRDNDRDRDRDDDRDRDRDRDNDRDRDRSSSSGISDNPFAFGVPNTELPVPGFGDLEAGPSLEALSKVYDRDIMRRVEEAIRRYDDNHNGMLEYGEWKDGRWSPSPEEHDKNKDNTLTRHELAERYLARSRSENAPSSSSRSSSNSSSNSSSSNSSSRSSSSSSGGDRGGWGGWSRDGSSSGSSGGWGRGDGSGGGDRMAMFAESMLRQYDANKDGKLEKDEWSKMRGDPKSSDKNNDDIISKEELVERLSSYSRSRGGDRENSEGSSGSRSSGSQSSGSSGKDTATPERKSYRFLTPAERLPEELPSWFTLNDADRDGQVAMSEFTTTWTDSKAAEFARLDANGDGFITAKECVKSQTADTSRPSSSASASRY